MPRKAEKKQRRKCIQLSASALGLCIIDGSSHTHKHKTFTHMGRSEECKKRKKLVVCSDDEENEEEKMEKFFALVRSFHEARNCLMINGSSDEATILKERAAAGEDQKKKRRIDEADPQKTRQEVSVWKPKFQHEDFMAAGLQSENPPPHHHHPAAVQANEIPEKEETIKESIDLNLSL